MSHNKIVQLTYHEAQKIAAGEVVERPANIVKELVENSLDAGSSSIALYLEQAGKKLIRIVDDGCGMSPEDASLCFLSHATSKIRSVDDLATLQSFGFRGEALASIAAVTQVTLTTKDRQSANNQLGYKIRYYEGKIQLKESIACSHGSDFSIENLFYNLPARAKFLKRDETEWNQVTHLFSAFCLSHRNVHFSLSHDKKSIHNLPATTSLKDRISQLWGFNFTSNLIALTPSHQQGFTLEGYISQPTFSRYSRQDVFFFVNNRWIKDTELSKALMKAYINVLPPGKFPAAFIFVTAPLDQVDVNVHPKKEEVRFAKPHLVKNLIIESVKAALENYVSDRLKSPSHNQTQASYEMPKIQPLSVPSKAVNLPSFDPFMGIIEQAIQPKHAVYQTHSPQPNQLKAYPSSNVNKSGVLELEENNIHIPNAIEDLAGYKIIGQLMSTYILLEKDDELIIIDQHAAHERVMYEKCASRFDKKDGVKLLFPLMLNFSEQETALVAKYKDFFLTNGLEFEPFGNRSIAVNATPVHIKKQCLQDFFSEIVAFIIEHEELDPEYFRKKLDDKIHGQMACKAAVKAGDVLTHEEIKKLITDLHKTNHRFICAHGRPTLWVISKYELEKKFKRC